MPYTKQTWTDSPSTTTPISAARLSHMEDGIDALDIWVDKPVPAGTVVGTTDTQTLTNKTLTSPAITAPTGITKTDVGLGSVDNTSDATKNSATATLTNKTVTMGANTLTGTLAQFNTAVSDADLAPVASPTFTGTLTTPVAKITTGAAANTYLKGASDGTASWEAPAGLNTVGVGRAVFIAHGGTIPGGTPEYTIVVELP